jgi:hypothetical protein
VRDDVVDEQSGRDPFAGEPTLHVREGDDDGVQLIGGHHFLQFGLRKQAGSCGSLSHVLCLSTGRT